MNKEIIKMQELVQLMSMGDNRTACGSMVRAFVDDALTNDQLVDIFLTIDYSNKEFSVMIDGANSLSLKKISAIKFVKYAGDIGLKDAKDLVEDGLANKSVVYTGKASVAYKLRDDLLEVGVNAMVVYEDPKVAGRNSGGVRKKNVPSYSCDEVGCCI